MRKKSSFFLLILLVFTFIFTSMAKSNELNELEQQLEQTKQQLESAQSTKDTTQTELERLENLKKQYEGSLNQLQNNFQITQSQLNLTQTTLTQKENELNEIFQQLEQTEKELQKRKIYIQTTIRALYMSESPDWSTTLLNVKESSLLTQTLVYKGAVIADIRRQIKDLTLQIHKTHEIKRLLEEIKTQLEAEKNSLVQKQHSLQNQIGETQNQITTAQSQQQNLQQALIGLEQQISELTQRQKEILAAKAAAALASTSVGNIEIKKAAIAKDPPKDGNVYFSFWTYGYPHRVGMNQYGALGRSMTGQSAEQILKSYYSGVEIADWAAPENITISTGEGNQEISFEDDYLMGIGEMPSCWGKPDRGGFEALKAQAIAARTYALSYTNNGDKPICITQKCQVYIGESKTQGACGEYWKQAVEETRSKVIVFNNQLITAWYASTAGGFTLSSTEVWGSSRPYAIGISDLDNNGQTYDGPSHANSPWYHKSWGNEPWLSFNQVQDLFNAALLPEDYNDQLDTFSSQEILKILVEAGIEPVTELKSIEIIDQNGNPGSDTAQVADVRAYYQDSKMAQVTGKRFKFTYNLRSPGTNAIWTTRFDVVTAAEL